MFDRDKKGHIHTNMVSTILRTLGQTFEEGDLQALIAEIDADGLFGINCRSFSISSYLIQEVVNSNSMSSWH